MNSFHMRYGCISRCISIVKHHRNYCNRNELLLPFCDRFSHGRARYSRGPQDQDQEHDELLQHGPGDDRMQLSEILGHIQPSKPKLFLDEKDHEVPLKPLFRTMQSDPTKHTMAHTGLYYEVGDEDYERYFKIGAHPKFVQMNVAFNQRCVMVRDPAVEIFDCLRQSDLSLPNMRYILYGPLGVGKSVTLGHVMSFCGSLGWIIVHFPTLHEFMRHPKETQTSSYNRARADTPLDSAAWLSYFQAMNASSISQMKLVGTYVFSKRDSSEAGSPLPDLIEYGLARTKYATDVMGALLKELRLQSSNGNIKTLVAIDGVNALWLPTLVSNVENKSIMYLPEELSIVIQLRKLLMNDWSGGAAVVTVDSRMAYPGQKASYTPGYLLTKEAMALFEPHIPVSVMNYNAKEACSCLEYFKDRKWIQRAEGYLPAGQQEILFLSSQNPLEMYHVCSRW